MSVKTEPWVAPPELTIYEAREVEAAFLESGGANGHRVYDLVQTEEVDACGIQWLLAVRARLKQHGFELELKNVNKHIKEQIVSLGLSFILGSTGEEFADG